MLSGCLDLHTALMLIVFLKDYVTFLAAIPGFPSLAKELFRCGNNDRFAEDRW
jgi:hypothetical protein